MKFSKENIEIIWHEDTGRYNEVVNSLKKKTKKERIIVFGLTIPFFLLLFAIIFYCIASTSDRDTPYIVLSGSVMFAVCFFICFLVLLWVLDDIVPIKEASESLEDSHSIVQGNIFEFISDLEGYTSDLMIYDEEGLITTFDLHYLELKKSVSLENKVVIDFQKEIIVVPYIEQEGDSDEVQ